MGTLIIELPEAIASKVRSSGISQRQLEAVLLRFVQKYVHDYPQVELERMPNADEVQLQQMAHAPADPLFMADLQDTMTAFAAVDVEWWGSVA